MEDYYCGCNKIALASQREITDAFLRLLSRQDFASITVSQICKEAGVSRQTFYSLFSSRENIILFELSQKHCYHPEEACEETLSLQGLCRSCSYYIADRGDFLSLLSHNGLSWLLHDSFYNTFMACDRFLPGQDERTRALTARFVAGGLAGVAAGYVECRQEMTRQELETALYRLFSGSCQDLL